MTDWYPASSAIDLRVELHKMIFGGSDFLAQGRDMVLRLMTDTHCECWDGVSGGPRGACPYCQGEGWKFKEQTEHMILFPGVTPLYKGGYLGTGQFPFSQSGYDDPNKATCFSEHSVFPDYERFTFRQDKALSKLYELKVNPDGSTTYPQIRTAKWKIMNITPIHGDFGRVEFFVLGLDREFIN